MKSSIKYIFIIIFSFLLFSKEVKALENIIVDCQKEQEYTICQIKGKSSYEVSAIEYRFSLPDNIKKIEFKIDESWEGDEQDNLVMLYTDENKKETFSIGTIKLNGSKEISSKDIKLENLIFYDADFQEHIIKNVNKEKNNNNSKKTSNNIIKYCVIISIGIIVLLFIVRAIKKGALL